jgi:hypothetical protein
MDQTGPSDIPSTNETFIAAATAAATAAISMLKVLTSPEEETTSDENLS